MSIVIDPAVLRETSHDLLRHGLDVADATAGVFAPDTGETTSLTSDGLAALLERAQGVADTLHDLADGLDTAARHALTTDGSVSGVLHALGSAETS